MRFDDLIRLAFANLRRNRSRSLMTLVGVLIGVAALLTLLSYGAGLQRSARSEFNALELYNTFRVTSSPNPINGMEDVAFQAKTTWLDTVAAVPITDSLLQVIAQLEGVLAAYPEIAFPVEVEKGEREVVATVEAVPMRFGDLAAYQPSVGAFFTAETDSALLIAPSMARRLGYDPAEAAVGDTVVMTTASLDLIALRVAAPMIAQGLAPLPIRKHNVPMRVAGLLSEDEQTVSGFVRVLMPLETARQMKKITFFSTLDLLLTRSTGEGYAAARVQLKDAAAHARVRQEIEDMGVFTTSFREQFARLDKLFLIADLALGIIGFIALLVATIGIANTMMMNVMERYREIGVMKAVGGDESDLQKLFVVESGTLGVLGGVLGLVVGWLLNQGIGFAVNTYLSQYGVPPLDLFYVSLPMVLGILAVALLVSLVAGLAPARRAARIEPIEALRSA